MPSLSPPSSGKSRGASFNDSLVLTPISQRSEQAPSMLRPEPSNLPMADSNSEEAGRRYRDSNVAMYIPSVNRVSPEPSTFMIHPPTEVVALNPTSFSSIYTTTQNVNPGLAHNNPSPPERSTIPQNPNRTIPADNISVNATNVRRNWVSHLVRSYRSISRTSKLMLILSIMSSIFQIIACAVVLSLFWNVACDVQLRIYVLLYSVRLTVSMPITALYYLSPTRRNRRTTFNAWIDRARSVMDVFAMLLFIVGNYLIYSTSSCKETNVNLYNMSLALVIIGYFIITIPVFFCGAVIFCLPCVLVVMRVLRVGEATGVGASPELINKLPIMRFDKNLSIPNKRTPETTTHPSSPLSGTLSNPPLPGEPQPTSTSPGANVSIDMPASPSQPRRSFFRTIFQTGKPRNYFCNSKKPTSTFKDSKTQLPVLKLEDEADAICAICLTEYADGDEIRNMLCNHHYHSDCVDEWLKQNRSCPLCKRDITGSTEPPSIDED